MRYAYRCTACALTAEPREQPRYARRDGQLHRRLAHHGYRPDGEEILRIPGVHDRALRGAARGAAAAGASAVGWWRTSSTAVRIRGSAGWLWARRVVGAVIVVYVLAVIGQVYL